jgi:hypothetical protein
VSRAFVLLNCGIGTENAITSEINNILGVSEATGLSGIYDIIAKLNAESDNGVSRIVAKIRSIANIRSRLNVDYGAEQPRQIILLLISPFFCEQLLHTFLLHMLHAPLWPAHAGDLHISHLI